MATLRGALVHIPMVYVGRIGPQVTLRAPQNVSKLHIKDYLEKLYGVQVADVRTLNTRRGYKKVMVDVLDPPTEPEKRLMGLLKE